MDPLEATAWQTRLRDLVRLAPLPMPSLVAVVASATAVVETSFPYVPGLLAFRELPLVRRALAGFIRHTR